MSATPGSGYITKMLLAIVLVVAVIYVYRWRKAAAEFRDMNKHMQQETKSAGQRL